MTDFWTHFSSVSLRKWRGTSPGPWWAPPETVTNGHEGVVVRAGIGVRGGAGMSRTGKETEMGSPTGPLYPRFIINHSCWAPQTFPLLLTSPSSTYKTFSPRWWQPIPPAPLSNPNTTPTLTPPQNSFCYLPAQESPPSLSPHRFLTPPHTHSSSVSPTTTFLAPLFFFSLSLCDKWVLIKADRAMKLKECIPWPAIALAWAWHWHI